MRPEPSSKVIIRDVTLREGLDVPGVEFSFPQRLEIAKALAGAGIPEIEVVAPGKVREDSGFAGICLENRDQVRCRTSGLVYSFRQECFREIDLLAGVVDRFDILVPLSPRREPFREDEKIEIMREALKYGCGKHPLPGAGFPHAFHADPAFLKTACCEAESCGAGRITIYDTDGSADPFFIYQALEGLRQVTKCELFFHAHNDLGMAAANSLAAVLAGADGLDATVNGLGDRAGNASLEQVVINLLIKGIATGILPGKLKRLSGLVEQLSGIPVHALAPVLGEFVFTHKSPGHRGITSLFEAFDPGLIED